MAIHLTTLNRCPLCKSTQGHRRLYLLESFQVYRCRCGHKFIDPSLDEDSMKEIYISSETLRDVNPVLEHYYEYNVLDPLSRTRRDYDFALRELAKFCNGREMLEVGCGVGGFLDFARENGWDVNGVDSSPENIRKMREKGIEGVASGFLAYSSSKKYDAIVFWDLIEHPQDPVLYISKSLELLKPGGAIFIAAPHDPNLLTVGADFLYKLSRGGIIFAVRQLYTLEHTSYFSSRTLCNLLRSKGLRVVWIRKTETDLARYKFSRSLFWLLRISFFVARCLRLQNRVMVIAKHEKNAPH